MNYRVLGVEYLTVSDSLPNQAHLHEDLGTKVWLAQFPETPQALILEGTLCTLTYLRFSTFPSFPSLLGTPAPSPR